MICHMVVDLRERRFFHFSPHFSHQPRNLHPSFISTNIKASNAFTTLLYHHATAKLSRRLIHSKGPFTLCHLCPLGLKSYGFNPRRHELDRWWALSLKKCQKLAVRQTASALRAQEGQFTRTPIPSRRCL